MPCSVRYSFSQHFVIPAQKAYEWCTCYTPADLELMGNSEGKRQIVHVADGTIILIDIIQTPVGVVEKQKLVQLYPKTFSWVSTHLSGPNKYSQFLYSISAENDTTSRLVFTALSLEYGKENLDLEHVILLAEKLCKEDSELWKLLAKAMEKELADSSRR